MVDVTAFLLDVEGVLVADKRYQAVPGAVGFIGTLRERGVPFRLITNNTTDSGEELLKKLHGAGFDFTSDELHTCTAAAITHLRGLAAKRCLVLGSERLRRIFADEGFAVTDAADVDAVVVGLDEGLTYDRLRLACEAVVSRGATLIALHRNRVYTDAQGRLCPSVGAIVEAIRYAARVEPVVIGKPSPTYFRQALDSMSPQPGTVMVVSDDPFSDLTGAKRLSMAATFVLSGKYADATVVERIAEAERPDFVLDSIGDLLTESRVRI